MNWVGAVLTVMLRVVDVDPCALVAVRLAVKVPVQVADAR